MSSLPLLDEGRPPGSSKSSARSIGGVYPSALGVGYAPRMGPILAPSQESLPTRSFSMPVPDGPTIHGLSFSHAARSRPLYSREVTASGLNIMSDDETEKKAFQPGVTTDESSAKDRSPSGRKDTRAEKVRRMVDELKRRCSQQELRIKNLEWHLTEELSRSRQLSDGISDTSKRLESRHAMFAEITKHVLPSMSLKIENAKTKSTAVQEALPKATEDMLIAETKYERDRVKASALEQHLQWRTTPWYTKARTYLSGSRPLNWHDRSSHRWETIVTIGIWVGGSFLVVVAAILAFYFVVYRQS